LKEGYGNLTVFNLRAECFMSLGYFRSAKDDLEFIIIFPEGIYSKYYLNMCSVKTVLEESDAQAICKEAKELRVSEMNDRNKD